MADIDKVVDLLPGCILDEETTLDEHNDDIAELFGMDDENGEINISASSERIHPKRNLGIMNGNFVMAEDFDKTPDCFKMYM